MLRVVVALVSMLLVGCATSRRETPPERWLSKHQDEHHYHESELTPDNRYREVPASVRAEAVASLKKEPFRRVTKEEYDRYGVVSLERVPAQSAYLLRAVRMTDRKYRLEVYRDHVEHRGHKEPPATATTLARARGPEFPPLEKTAVVYVDSRPPEKLNVDYMRRR